MANIRDLKKSLNHVLGDIMNEAYYWELDNPGKDISKSQSIIDEAIETFDELIAKVNDRDVEDRKAHLKAVKAELEERGRGLIDKINALG